MSIKFFRLVKAMRQAQREYYQSRSKEALAKALTLEKRVDVMIARGDAYLAAHPELAQPTQSADSLQ